MAGTLDLIPNTLGLRDADDPLQDVIPTGVQQITAQLDYFVAEHAKTARPPQEITIRELNVKTPESELEALLAPVVGGRDAGLMSEAGVPAVADPGANLVRRAHRHGVRVKPLVGPSSILLAVMASGLNGQRFAFNGYLPVDAGERTRKLRALEQVSRAAGQTQVFIETPYRNGALLEAIQAVCAPGTLLSVAVDLTLPSEQVVTLPVGDWRPDRLALHKRPAIFSLLAR